MGIATRCGLKLWHCRVLLEPYGMERTWKSDAVIETLLSLSSRP